MARKVNQIRIESILGGHSPMTHFAAENQYQYSSAIDPEYGISDTVGIGPDAKASGLLKPIASEEIEGGVVGATPMWIVSDPVIPYHYLYDAGGSIYTLSPNLGTITGLGDLNDGQSASGNGAAFYDNYVYFATDTTVARYGPVNGTPAFTDDYWVGSLGKTALNESNYPLLTGGNSLARHPTHILHRHSDGKLYILDIVDGSLSLSYIETKKTTVDGDTDAGSTYDAFNYGRNLYPTAIESYGEFLVIAAYEASDDSGQVRARDSALSAKIIFWDTTSENPNSVVWVEYPDPFISAIKNVGGVLHFISSNGINYGFRVLQYIGGTSFREVFFSNIGSAPHPGAVDVAGNRMIFGSKQALPDSTYSGCVYQLGSKISGLNDVVHNVASTSQTGSGVNVTALRFYNRYSFNQSGMLIGWLNDDTVDDFGADFTRDIAFAYYGYNPVYWISQLYKIGQPFKITKIRIPLAAPLGGDQSLVPSIWGDGFVNQTTLTTINVDNYGSDTQMITIRPENLVCDYSFAIELKWNPPAHTATTAVVALPITIEYELLDVDTSNP